MADPLTPEERSVMRVLSAGRPKRNLHVYALLGVGIFFLAMALWKGMSRSSDSASRVSARPGPKAPAEEPSPGTLRDLLQKQSSSVPSAKSETTSDAKKAAVPQPPMGVMAFEEMPRQPIPSVTPERSPELERKLVEAGFMTAKTEVYVQPAAPPAPVISLAKDDSRASDAIVGRNGSTTEALMRALESGAIGKMPGSVKASGDDRIAARARDQEDFGAKSSRAIRGPQRAVPSHELVVAEGTSIPAVLTRAVASDLPGPVEAMVISDVYDSSGQGRLLIPKGSRLVGSYNSAVAIGQQRLQLVFTRLRLPSGASVAMDGAPAADNLGRSGAAGEVDNHYLRMLGSALAMGLITLAVERRLQRDAASPNGTVNVYGGSSGTTGSAAAQAFGNVTNQLLERNLGIGPTINIAAGTRIRVHVVRDLAIMPEAVL